MRAEALERDIEIGPNLIGGPSRPVRFGDEPRQLAEHRGHFASSPNPFFPFPLIAAANVRLREMIQHEALARKLRHQLGCHWRCFG